MATKQPQKRKIWRPKIQKVEDTKIGKILQDVVIRAEHDKQVAEMQESFREEVEACERSDRCSPRDSNAYFR